jgi:hypothetical protein
MSDNFDRWLEDELGNRLDSVDPGYVAPRYLESSTPPRRGRLAGLLAGLPLPALLTTKVAAASMVVLAATGTGVAVKTATTGTPNPLVWGQQVKDQVQKCKDALPAGQHGIGKCVSEFATQHGSTSSESGTGSSSDSAGDNGKGNANGQPTSHPTSQGKSDSHATPQGKSDSHPTPPPHPTPQASSNAAANGVGNGNGTP